MSNFSSVNSLPSGDYAEVGVFQGDGAKEISEWMLPDAKLWLVDSFQGHRDPTEFDNAGAHPRGRYADTSPEIVRAKVPNAYILTGYVPEVLRNLNGLMFRYVRIDMDHYIPIKAASEFFRTRMVHGGIIEFDDYNCPDCPGANRAVDEVFGAAAIKGPVPHWVNE